MYNNISHASSETLVPRETWQAMSNVDRLASINRILTEHAIDLSDKVSVTSAKQDGQAIFQFKEPVDASRRGTILLDLEELLKAKVDPGITVWLEPLGDRNSLRNLRGIEVKS